jgi:hypothetical protein
MFTIIITLLLPLVSLGIWRQYVLKNNGSTGKTVTGRRERMFFVMQPV